MVAVAVEVTLILLIVGIMLGMLNDYKTRQAGIGADIMVQPPGSSLLMGVSGAPVSVKVADKLRGLPHVIAVTPVVTQRPPPAPWRSSTALICQRLTG